MRSGTPSSVTTVADVPEHQNEVRADWSPDIAHTPDAHPPSSPGQTAPRPPLPVPLPGPLPGPALVPVWLLGESGHPVHPPVCGLVPAGVRHQHGALVRAALRGRQERQLRETLSGKGFLVYTPTAVVFPQCDMKPPSLQSAVAPTDEGALQCTMWCLHLLDLSKLKFAV